MSLAINKWCLMYSERRLIFIMLIICFSMSVILLIFQTEIIIFCLIYSLLLITSNILETFTSSLYAKIISPNIFNTSGYIIILSTTGGRFIGSCLVTLFACFNQKYSFTISFGFYTMFFLLVLCVVYKHYQHLRVKAISRIIKKLK